MSLLLHLVNFAQGFYQSLAFQSAIETFIIITIYIQTDPLLTFNHATQYSDEDLIGSLNIG
jgi:hypothetical protein